MTSLKKKKSGLDVKANVKDKDKEDKGLSLQLVPEYVDKRALQQGNHNHNYVFAGALYIPKDILQLVNANDTGAGKIYMGPIKNGGNVFDSDDQMVEIEDPDIRKYVIRILRYFKYDPEEAMATLRDASFKIKNRARGIIKRTHSQNTVTKLQAWRAKIQYSEIIGESEEELLNTQSNSVFPKNVQNIPLNEEEDKDEYVYNGGHEEVNKQSFIQRTLTRLFSTKSTTKINKSQREISSSGTNNSYYSEGEKSSSKTNKWKAKKSKSMSQLRNEGNKQVTGLLSSVTTGPNEKKVKLKKNENLNLNKIISRKIKKLITMLKTIYYKKSNVDNKEAKNQTDFIYSDMYFNYQGASIKKSSLKLDSYQLKQEELLLNYLTAPRIHHFGTYTVMPLRNENPHTVRTHHRKKALKRMKKRLQSIETFPFRSFEVGEFCDHYSMFNPASRNLTCPRFDKMIPKHQRFTCSKPRFETYSMVDNRTNDRHKSEVTRQSVDIIADTFVDVIDSPTDPKCKVEITGHGYKGKFNVGLDPIIDEVLYNSLQNLKETYENSRFSNDTRGFDKRRNHSLASIAYNVRDYLKSKVTGRNPIRNNISDQFSSENVIGRTSIHREENDIYRENSPQIICEDTNVKHRRHRHNLNRKHPPSTKISRYFMDNEKYKCKPNCHKRNNPRREKKRRTINSSGSESFEERQFTRKTRDHMPQVLESSDDSFILGETNSTLDESTRLSITGGSTTNEENKKGSLKTRVTRNQKCSPGLSYISKKDWRAAAELLRREREGSMFSTDKSEPVKYMSLNEYECEKSDKKSVQNNSTGNKNNSIGNSKIVKVKETMTTTANGVTTVTQTEVIEAINQSSQCLIPSTSGEAFGGRRDFTLMPLTTRKEELGGRLAKVFQDTPRHSKLHEEVPFKRGINHEVVLNRNKENPQHLGDSSCACPREFQCYEVIDDKKYFNGTEKLFSTSPQNSNRYNDLTSHNAELGSQNDMRKKGHCYCNPNIVNTYTLSKEMTMTPHVETTDFSPKKHIEPKRKFSALHKVSSDPINTCVTKPNFINCTQDAEDKMHIKVNAISKIEGENPPFRSKQNLQEQIPLEKSWEQESNMPEEVICTQSGAAKIRVSLGSCDTTQRQKVYLELMKVLKHKLESENQLLNNNAKTHAVKFCDLEDSTTRYSKKKIGKETFGKINETATLMPLATETCSKRMHLVTGSLKNCNVSTKKRNCITTCRRPCLCDEKRNSITSQSTAEKIVPKQTISSDSLMLNKEETPKPSIKYRNVSTSVQSEDLFEPIKSVDTTPKEVSITEAHTPINLEEKQDSPEMVTTSTQTEDLEARSSPKSSLNKQSLSSPKQSMTEQSSNLPKSNITKQAPSSGKRRASSPLPRKSSTRKSRSKIKTGSLFSKSFSEKNSIQASRWRPSELSLSEKFPEEPRKPSIPETKKEEDQDRKSSLHESEKKKSSSLSSKRESTLSKRGSLFVRRSTPSSVYGSARSHQSSVTSQRIWIQNLNVPMKSDDEAEIKKGKITESSKASAIHNLNNVSSIYSQSSETESSIVNSGWKRKKCGEFNKRDFVPHNPENSDSPQQATSMIYSSPKQSKKDKYIAAHVRKVSRKSGLVASVSFVPFQNSSSFIEINTEPTYIEDTFSKLTSEPSVLYSGDSDNSSVFSKYATGSIVSSDALEKSNCSLLSFENSPLLVEYVENFEQLPSALSANSNNSRNNSTEKKSLKHRIMNSKPMLYGEYITTLNETEKPSPVWPDSCDSISLHCFSETNDEDIKMIPHSSLKTKNYPSNLVSGCTTITVKPTLSPNSKTLRGLKNSTSESSDSKTTVISRPTIYNNPLAISLHNFIRKPTGGTIESAKSNNNSNPPKRKKGSSVESAEFSERKNSVINRCKRPFMRSDLPDLGTIQNPSVVRTISSDDADFYDDSNLIPDCEQSDAYSTDPSRSQKPIQGQKKDSDGSEVIVENISSKHCNTEAAKLRKHNRKPKIEKIVRSTLHNHSINSTLCIYDKTNEYAEEIESDEANRTTIGFDCSNVSLKKDRFKVTKCYKHRAIDDTIRSSAAWIVTSSDSDLGTTANNAKYISKRSKSIEKNESKYQTTDLRQSSSELLEQRKKSNKRRIFVHTKRSYKSNKFEPRERSKMLIPSILEKKNKLY